MRFLHLITLIALAVPAIGRAQTAPAESLEALVRRLQAESANRTRDDAEFAREYVGVTSARFRRASDAGKPLDERRAAFQLALEAAENFGKAVDAMALVDDWAAQLMIAQRYDEAEPLLARVVDREGAAGDMFPFLLERYAQTARARRDFGEALARLERAQTAIQSMSDDEAWRSTARCEVGITRARIESELGRIDAAYARLRALRSEPALTADPALAVRIELELGQLALAIDDYALLDELISDQLLERVRATDPAHVPAALFVIAAARYRAARDLGGDRELARRLLDEAAAAASSPALEIAARLFLVNLNLLSGELAEAREQLDRVEALEPVEPELRARCAAMRVAVALREGAPEARLEIVAQELGRDLDEWCANMRSLPLQKSGVGLLYWGSARLALAEWVRVQCALDPSERGIAKALGPILEAQALGTLARSLDARTTLEDVRRTLIAPGVGVLTYLPGPNHSHVFGLDSNGLFHRELEGDFTLRAKAAALESSWNAPPAIAASELETRRVLIERAGRTAAEAFLPLELRDRVASWDICVVSGTDACMNPSFECFVLDGGQFLGLTKAIAYLPSLPVGVRLCERESSRVRASRPEAVLIAAVGVAPGASSSAAKLAALRVDDGELHRAMAAFDPAGVESRLRAQASLAALREPIVGDAGVLTILAHGAYDASVCGADERPAFLLLAPSDGSSGSVCCAAVESLRLPPLVELLACGTARGPTRMGDGAAAHLVGACFLGSAGAVLAARTEVELGATLALATRFHEALRRDGLSPALALLAARRATASTSGRDDPWYWAGLALHGHASAPLFEAGTPEPAVADESGSALLKWGALTTAGVIASAFVVYRLMRARRSS